MMSRQGVDPGATTLGATDPSDAAVRKSRGGRPPRISREEVIAAGKAAADRMGKLLKNVIPKLI
jgi:purine-nucleoside phosphorylase